MDRNFMWECCKCKATLEHKHSDEPKPISADDVWVERVLCPLCMHRYVWIVQFKEEP